MKRLRRLLLNSLASMKVRFMEASFIDDLGADSLDIVELIMALRKNSTWKYRQGSRKSQQLDV